MKSLFSKPDPEASLIKKAQQGDREALRALLEELGPPVQQWALAHTGDPDAASDLCQEVFIVLLEKISSYRADARFLTWLFTVTRNQALDQGRRKGRHERKMDRFRVELGGAHGTHSQAEQQVDRERLSGLVAGFVRDLPERQREVFQLSEFQDMSSPEIGTVLGLSAGSVRAALLKARRSLRRKILESHPEFVEEYLP